MLNQVQHDTIFHVKYIPLLLVKEVTQERKKTNNSNIILIIILIVLVFIAPLFIKTSIIKELDKKFAKEEKNVNIADTKIINKYFETGDFEKASAKLLLCAFTIRVELYA